ncbi:DUF7678 domain-containing protein [Lactococcus lactis]
MWSRGILMIEDCELSYEVKHFEAGSKYGINGGKISKLWIHQNGKWLVNYDRGWDVQASSPIAKAALKEVLRRYN